jgi:peptidyl-prolyl cis-trans isomerase A (cyclophilin A)
MEFVMSRMMVALLLSLVIVAPCLAGEKIVMETSLGNIVLELDGEKAPASVANFLSYVDEGFYNQTIFHRVISGFMIQGGGFDTDKHTKPTKAPIRNEAQNGLKNGRGTIAMARTNQVDSATSQFFINLVDNAFLNYRSPDAQGFGYAVFGKVIEGIEVVDKIAGQKTANQGGPFANLPLTMVEIIRVKRLP